MSHKDNNEQKNKAHLTLGSASGIGGVGILQILSLFPLTAPIGAAGTVILSAWQSEQQKKFISEVEQKIEALEQKTIKQSLLDSDEFKEIVARIWDNALKTASDLKRKALASVLVNSATQSQNSLAEKSSLLRTLLEISDREILVFTVIQSALEKSVSSCHEKDIELALNLSSQEVHNTCEDLEQLRLIALAEPNTWTITQRGLRLIVWWSGLDKQEILTAVQERVESELGTKLQEVKQETMIAMYDTLRKMMHLGR
ncbi:MULTISPECIES: hypothetical protein [Trichocoleus]|uniref:Uncharacterized protein n=1 Tax=Trichocoleus desertorum GB2-A4 TaxID=2933944 RepID=A0ABV0J5E4_9CYAN|nr:hypothetical protein [Trichocoleus sp. FACHB-46]MBD1861622.1 hypothetical protein [Trichocoleus sp. FACHB-46]